MEQVERRKRMQMILAATPAGRRQGATRGAPRRDAGRQIALKLEEQAKLDNPSLLNKQRFKL
jgi:hypothetical protein